MSGSVSGVAKAVARRPALVVSDRACGLEPSGILDEAQHGFKAGRGPPTAGISVMALYERAERNRQPLTGIFLDIKKAYDSVERGAGKASPCLSADWALTLTRWSS